MVFKKEKQQINSINMQKLDGLHKSFSYLPKNFFSKIIVVFCLVSIVAIIIASYILLVLGYDTSSLITPSLCALSGELLILGAKRILAKSEAIQDTVLEEIKGELKDGKIYDLNGNIVGYEEQSSNFSKQNLDLKKLEEETDINIECLEEDLENNQLQLQSFPTLIKNTPISTPKKRGRPKKISTKEEKIEDNDKEENLVNSSSWLDEDMSD